MRAVIDTNVWISAMLRPGGHASRVVEALANGEFTALVSRDTLLEIRDVVTRPKLLQRYGLRTDQLVQVLSLIELVSEVVEVGRVEPLSRDPKDDIFLAVAVSGRAHAIVTRDDDLKGDPAVLEFAEASGFQILTIQQFLDLLATR